MQNHIRSTGTRCSSATLLALAFTCALQVKTLSQTPLRITTLNVEVLTAPGVRAGAIQKYRWDVTRRAQFERAASLIEALNLDIFNLLEATSCESVDLLVDILHEKGLNEERDSVTQVSPTIKNYDASTPAPELLNAASKIRRQADRFTSHWDRNENGAEDPYDVVKMIDHVLLPVELKPRVTQAFIFHNLDHRTTDHRAVVVDLELPHARRDVRDERRAARTEN